jgi:addiction module HigA family antidote
VFTCRPERCVERTLRLLLEEFLIPFGLSQYRLAKAIGVPEARISAICAGKRAITADTALRLSRFFGTSAGFWLGLQADYDLEEAVRAAGDALSRIERFRSEPSHA